MNATSLAKSDRLANVNQSAAGYNDDRVKKEDDVEILGSTSQPAGLASTSAQTIPEQQGPMKRQRAPPKRKAQDETSNKKAAEGKKRQTTRSKKTPPQFPWPEAFVTLGQTHRALNLVYTFCRTRKHFATTFDTMKSAVEAQTGGRELTVETVAALKVLLPRAIRFEVVSSDALEILGSGEPGQRRKNAQGRNDWSDLKIPKEPDSEETKTKSDDG
ncbi:hypothetical protein KEM55_006658, partial [Ascosphaera atra]